MYPSVYIFGKTIFLYDILTNTGTILGLGIMFFLLYKYGIREKKYMRLIFFRLFCPFLSAGY